MASQNGRRKLLAGNGTLKWVPTNGQLSEKMWSVETKETGKIFVWGGCSDCGRSQVLTSKPEKDGNGLWWSEIGGFGIELSEKNLFPKDKPQKFLLVPVDENDKPIERCKCPGR